MRQHTPLELHQLQCRPIPKPSPVTLIATKESHKVPLPGRQAVTLTTDTPKETTPPNLLPLIILKHLPKTLSQVTHLIPK